MKKLIFITLLLVVWNLNAYSLSNIVSTLKQVESLGDTRAIGDGGKALGILQIHNIYVEEVNQQYGTNYTHKQMFNEVCAEEVFYLYMKYASKKFCEKYGEDPTEEDIVRMHNGGLYKGYRMKATIKYYKRYLKFKNI